jgi:transcriptional regulator with XRE-family HTH domain
MLLSATRTFSPDRLRARRKEQGLTREQLAFAIGRTYATVCLYEQGYHAPPPEVLEQLAAFLNCSREDFFVEDGQ